MSLGVSFPVLAFGVSLLVVQAAGVVGRERQAVVWQVSRWCGAGHSHLLSQCGRERTGCDRFCPLREAGGTGRENGVNNPLELNY